MSETKELVEVWFSNDGSHVHQDAPDVNRIALICDGNGISGYYDRIHIFYKSGITFVCPAHNSCGWTEKAILEDK